MCVHMYLHCTWHNMYHARERYCFDHSAGAPNNVDAGTPSRSKLCLALRPNRNQPGYFPASWLRTRFHLPRETIHFMHRASQNHARCSLFTVAHKNTKREAWTRGVLCARARETALDDAFSSAFGSLQVRTSEQDEAALAAEREEAERRAAACSTVWDAARYGVPVRTLRELMERKINRRR